MIFVTVGTQLPFDRLVQGVDSWVGRNPDVRVFAQIGEEAWPPEHLHSIPFLSATSYETAFRSADLVVSHAGVGVVLTAIRLGKPLIVMPRRHHLGEHRSEHQVGVCRERFPELGVNVAWTPDDLHHLLDRRAGLVPPQGAGKETNLLITHIREFLSTQRTGT